MSDLQTMFNTAVEGLAKQKFKQSVKRNGQSYIGTCLFRGPDGMKCAIGHCLNDDEIVLTIIGYECTIATNNKAAKKYNTNHRTVVELQECHDNNKYAASMKNALIDFAIRHNLTIPDVLK